jgi:transcriptional regulator with XRE-family HTH domain
MTQWMRAEEDSGRPVDPEVLEEAALFSAQATIQRAIDQRRISRADLARSMGRPRSFVSRMLSGSHNLTVKTLARALAACGFELRLELVPIRWGWTLMPAVLPERRLSAPVPAPAGTPALAA